MLEELSIARPSQASTQLKNPLRNEPMHETADTDQMTSFQWSWSCRSVDASADWQLKTCEDYTPCVGDVAVVEVVGIGNHRKIMTSANQRLQLYPGDQFVGVFGNRYATDAFEAEVHSIDDLHILTSAGMLGTVCSKNGNVKAPTQVRFKGVLADSNGKVINLKSRALRSRRRGEIIRQVLLVVGTGMNSGKTTTAVRLVKGLVNQGVRVAAFKLTGSVSHRDLFEFQAASPAIASDFSDYGFPSTYLSSEADLSDLFHTMMADANSVSPDIVVMEVADGILQRETEILLRDQEIAKHVAGVLLTAPCALSALQAVQQIESSGHEVVGVSGIITNAPLFEREFERRSNVPIYNSGGYGEELATKVMQQIRVAAE